MKNELAAILSALAAIGVQKKGRKPKPPGRSTSDALGPVYARDWIKCYMCRQWGRHIAAECTRTQQKCDNLTPGPKLPPSGPAEDLLFNPN
jgi:hypothetical protein